MTGLDAQQSRKIPQPADIKPKVTPGCARVISKLMMKDPKYRYKSWSSAVTDLSKLAGGKIVVPKVAAGAESTVAKAGEMVPESGPGARKPALAKKQVEERHKELKKKYGRQQAPLWLRLPLEVLLLAWLVFLVYQLHWRPMHPPAPEDPVVTTEETSSANPADTPQP